DFARKPGVHAGFLADWDSRFGRSVIPSTARFAVGGDRSARRSPGRPVPPASRGDHQPLPSAGAAGGGDRLGLSGATLELGVWDGARAAAVADAAGGRAVHSQAYAQPLRRGAARAMGGEPVFPVLLWGSGVPA